MTHRAPTRSLRAATLAALVLAATGAGAQEVAQVAEATLAEDIAVDPTAAVETSSAGDPLADGSVEDLSPLDRWRADPTTVFDATEVDLASLLYVARPLIVLAASPEDPLVVEQLALLRARVNELVARDVFLIVDTDPTAASAIRAQFRPRGFSMLLLDTDGTIALRKPVPWNVREIVHTIDRLPSRQRELRDN